MADSADEAGGKRLEGKEAEKEEEEEERNEGKEEGKRRR